jgi:alkanesulfonate monooxygenase SsuD/methylene tetrahydromethanopterin reductase-like flavin-dependent oxidoreductase (luciferase family)
MKIGIAMFPTVDAPAPGRLAPMIEDRGLESLWFAEHSHLPVGKDRSEGGDGGGRYAKTFDPFVAMTAAAAATTTLKVATGVCLVHSGTRSTLQKKSPPSTCSPTDG